MSTKLQFARYAMAIVAFLQLTVQATHLSNADEKHSKEGLSKSVYLVPQDPPSLRLKFHLRKDDDGTLWGGFDIHNDGKNGLVMCDMMRVSILAKTDKITEDFNLEHAKTDFSRYLFHFVDARPPKKGIVGTSVLNRRVEVDPLTRELMFALKWTLSETKTTAEIFARVEGTVLKWDAKKEEYVRVNFRVSSTPEPWKKYAPLITRVPGWAEKHRPLFRPSDAEEVEE